MKTCAQYKALIDDLAERSADAQRDLLQHVADCPECAEYKGEADRTAALFRELGNRFAAHVQTDRARETLDRRLRSSQRQTVLALSGCAAGVVALVGLGVQNTLTPVGAVILLLWCLCCGYFAWRFSHLRSKTSLSDGPLGQDVYWAWQVDLERRIKLTRIIAAVVALEVVITLAVVAFARVPFVRDGTLVFLGLVFVASIGVIAAVCVELPRLREELSLVRDGDGA